MIKSFLDFLHMIEHNRVQDFPEMRAVCEQSPLFCAQVKRYIAEYPNTYRAFSKRALRVERARRDRELGDVHDPLLSGPREGTKSWLSEQDLTVWAHETAQHLKKKQELLFWVESSRLSEPNKDKLREYIPFFFEKYEEGATGSANLFRAMTVIDRTADGVDRDTDEDIADRIEKRAILLEGILDGARAYEQDSIKYYPGTDYSCMPGLDERVVDAMTSVRLSLMTIEQEATNTPAEVSPAEKYASLSRDPFLIRDPDPNPSDLLYALYIHAAYPNGLRQEDVMMHYTTLLSPNDEGYQKAYNAGLKSFIQEVQKDIAEYYQACADHAKSVQGAYRRMGSYQGKLDIYFTRIDISNSMPTKMLLEEPELSEAIAKQYHVQYEKYQVFAQEKTDEHSMLIPVPIYLQGSVRAQEERLTTRYVDTECSPQEIIKRLTDLTGFDKASMISILLLSGGAEKNLFGGLDAKRERGDRVCPELVSIEHLKQMLKTIGEQRQSFLQLLDEADYPYALEEDLVYQRIAQRLLEGMGYGDVAGDMIGSAENYLDIFFNPDKRHYLVQNSVRNPNAISDPMPTEIYDIILRRVLVSAVEQGEVGFIDAVLDMYPQWINLESHIPINRQYVDGISLLMIASQNQQIGSVRALLSREGGKELIGQYADNGYLCTHYAAWAGDTELLQILLENGPPDLLFAKNTDRNSQEDDDIEYRGAYNQTVLHIIAGRIDLEPHFLEVGGMVDFVLAKNSNQLLFMQNSHGKTALHYAVERGYEQMVQKFLAQPNAEGLIKVQDNEGADALHVAIFYEQWTIASMLIQADPSIVQSFRNGDGQTLLHIAVAQGAEDFARQVLDIAPSLLLEVDQAGDTALHYTMMGAFPVQKEMLVLLLKQPNIADVVSLENNYQVTVLSKSVSQTNLDIVLLLIQAAPNIVSDFRTNNGRTLLHVAVENGDSALAQEILKIAPQLLLKQDNTGQTALHKAYQGRQRDNSNIVKLLLEENNVQLLSIQDNQGKTALHYAAAARFKSLCLLVNEADANILQIRDCDQKTAFDYSLERLEEYEQCASFLAKNKISIDCLLARRANKTVLHTLLQMFEFGLHMHKHKEYADTFFSMRHDLERACRDVISAKKLVDDPMIQYIAQYGYEDFYKIFVEFHSQIFLAVELPDYLRNFIELNAEGSTKIHCVIEWLAPYAKNDLPITKKMIQTIQDACSLLVKNNMATEDYFVQYIAKNGCASFYEIFVASGGMQNSIPTLERAISWLKTQPENAQSHPQFNLMVKAVEKACMLACENAIASGEDYSQYAKYLQRSSPDYVPFFDTTGSKNKSNTQRLRILAYAHKPSWINYWVCILHSWSPYQTHRRLRRAVKDLQLTKKQDFRGLSVIEDERSEHAALPQFEQRQEEGLLKIEEKTSQKMQKQRLSNLSNVFQELRDISQKLNPVMRRESTNRRKPNVFQPGILSGTATQRERSQNVSEKSKRGKR